MKISMIVAVSHNGVIGKDNKLPWHLPSDLSYFKRNTVGKTVLMGRKTFESIGKPLPDRRNIVISGNPTFCPAGVEVFSSVRHAIEQLSAEGKTEELMIIGGDSIYREASKYADRIYRTVVMARFNGDAHFTHELGVDWILTATIPVPADAANKYAHKFEIWDRLRA